MVGSYGRSLLHCERVNARAYDHHILLAVATHVSHRVGVSLGIQLRFPKQPASSRIEGAESLVDRAGDKYQSSSSRDRAALSERAGIMDAFGFQFVAGAERNAPCNIAGVGVDGHQFSPGPLLARQLRGRVPAAALKPAAAERAEAAV